MSGSTLNTPDYESCMKMKKVELVEYAHDNYGFTMRRNLTKQKLVEIFKFLDNGEIE